MRRNLCREFRAQEKEEGLQGDLLSRLAEATLDPDAPVRRWLQQEAVPLGVEVPIEPGGVFPPATYTAAEDALDRWSAPTNYLSFDEHRVGAEAIIERERSAGWLDWRATAAELEAAHGAVTYSRIGVIAKSPNAYCGRD